MAATKTTVGRGAIPRDARSHAHRARLVAAMSEVASQRGWARAGVEHVCRQAGMSRRTYYEEFSDAEQCFVEAVGQAFDGLCATVRDAVLAGGVTWADRVSDAVAVLLATLDADPVLARLCLVEPLAGSAGALTVRRRAIARLTALVAEGGRHRGAVPRQTDLGAIGAIWELAHDHVTDPEREGGLVEVVVPAVYLALVPYLGPDAALAYAEGAPARFAAAQAPAPPLPSASGPLAVRVTELTRSTLLYLADHPGARNCDVAEAVGVSHESQISRHLGRLEHQGMVRRQRKGRANAWRLSAAGVQTAAELRAPEPPTRLGAFAMLAARQAEGAGR